MSFRGGAVVVDVAINSGTSVIVVVSAVAVATVSAISTVGEGMLSATVALGAVVISSTPSTVADDDDTSVGSTCSCSPPRSQKTHCYVLYLP